MHNYGTLLSTRCGYTPPCTMNRHDRYMLVPGQELLIYQTTASLVSVLEQTSQLSRSHRETNDFSPTLTVSRWCPHFSRSADQLRFMVSYALRKCRKARNGTEGWTADSNTTRTYRSLSNMHPWAMNFSGCSKRRMGVFRGPLPKIGPPVSKVGPPKYRMHNNIRVPYCNSHSSKALLLHYCTTPGVS